MKNHFLLLFAFTLFNLSMQAQFFQKVDDDFKFNGTDLRIFAEDQTKDFILLEETESYREYKPKKDIIKNRNYTLSSIRYYTNFKNEIFEIECMNTGDVVERAYIKTDMAKGAYDGVVSDDGKYHYTTYKHDRTTDVLEEYERSDTSYIGIVMAWYLSDSEDYRENHSFLPVLGMVATEDKAREFLFQYQVPEGRDQYENLKWLDYFALGIEIYLQGDTIMQATVFNADEEFKKYTGAMPYDLNIDDTRKEIKEKLGIPESFSSTNNVWYYNRPNLQINIIFSNDPNSNVPATEDDQVLSMKFAVKED
jgi:hypothetical protein